MTVRAVYENGVFRPTEKVDLPDRCEVEVEIRQVKDAPKVPTLDEVYAILGRRPCSGERDLAERHNEHQPSRDEWERLLRSAATDCGVSLSNEAVSSEGLYD